MTIFNNEMMTRFNLTLPVWLKQNLQALSEAKGENANSLIIQALLKQYPEIQKPKNQGPSLIGKLIHG